MAHEIETAFFTGKPAWHNLGTVVQDAPSIKEALKLSGLDWHVTQEPISLLNSDNSIPSHKAIMRETDGSVLGVVGKDWTPVQNKDAFDFFDNVIDDGTCKLEAAGSLRNGKRVWVLAKIAGSEAAVKGSDFVQMYLLLHNSHDGSCAVGVQFTPTRVVCMNTLSLAMNEAEANKFAAVKIYHRKNVHLALELTKKAISISQQTFAYTIEQYRTLAAKGLPVDGLRKYVVDVFGNENEKDKEPRCYKHIERAYYEGAGNDLPGVRGTYWGAYNAVTDFITHERGRSQETRLEAGWFGSGAALTQKALEVALTH